MVEVTQRFYKIRRLKDGLFANGERGNFGKFGKAWSRLSDVMLHLNYNFSQYEREPSELVEFGTVVLNTTPMDVVIADKEIRDREREAEDTRKRELREMARLEELKAKYGR